MIKYLSSLACQKLTLLPYIFYFLIAFLFLPFYEYQINPDGINYLDLAEKYIRGEYGDAINSAWGPLYSWLLIPFLNISRDPLLATKFLAILIGAFVMISSDRLLKVLKVKTSLRFIGLMSLIFVVVSFTFRTIEPDLLLTAELLLYFSVIFDAKYPSRPIYGIMCGIIGTVAFLTKNYAFFFFLFHFPLMNLIYYLTNRGTDRLNIKKGFLLGFTCFILVSGIWIAVLSQKYGYLSIGNSGGYNQKLMGPTIRGNIENLDREILLVPPNKSARSAGEDSSFIDLPTWSPLSSVENLIYQIQLVVNNLFAIQQLYVGFSVLSFWIIIAFFIDRANAKSIREYMVGRQSWIFLTFMMFPLGYSLLIVEERYLWPMFFLVVIMGFVKLNDYLLVNYNKLLIFGLLLVFVLSFNFLPSLYLVKNRYTGKEYFENANVLKNDLGIYQTRVGGNSDVLRTIYVTYLIDSKFYYRIGKEGDPYKYLEFLKENNVEYYFVWDRDDYMRDILARYPKVSQDKISRLSVYRIKE